MSIAGEDLAVLNSGVFGDTTSGQWQFYYDGSDVGLGGENLWGASIDSSNGDLYLSTQNGFSAGGVSGDGADILLCSGALVRPQ